MVNCKICKSDSTRIIDDFGNGLVINKCTKCKVIFLIPNESATGYGYSADFIHEWVNQKRNSGIFKSGYEIDIERLKDMYIEVTMPLREIEKSSSILEIGAGGGLVTYLLNNLGFNVKGIEPNEHFANFAFNTLGVNVQTFDLFQYSTNEKFDVVLLNSVIEHLTDPVKALVRIRETFLNQGGKLILTAPNAQSLEYIRDYDKWHNFNLDHIWYFSEESLENTAKEAGFKVEKFYQHNYEFSPEMEKQLNFINHYLGFNFNPYGGLSAVFVCK